jgi:3-deoxy-manno-octulosonate cytidylyltransferase (CMP-KDO synthetase)
MVEHVRRRVALCKDIDEVVVATPDEEIRSVVESFGGRVAMTSDAHERASDRVAEVAERTNAEVFVMVQGDEPLITPMMVSLSLGPFSDPAVQCVNLTGEITTQAELLNPNVIKVVRDTEGRALYFSRQPIPSGALVAQGVRAWKQVCIIPFRREAVLRFASLEPTHGEIAESVDMLRFLEHGMPVHLVESEEDSIAVDVQDDVAPAEALLDADPLVLRYTD